MNRKTTSKLEERRNSCDFSKILLQQLTSGPVMDVNVKTRKLVKTGQGGVQMICDGPSTENPKEKAAPSVSQPDLNMNLTNSKQRFIIIMWGSLRKYATQARTVKIISNSKINIFVNTALRASFDYVASMTKQVSSDWNLPSAVMLPSGLTCPNTRLFSGYSSMIPSAADITRSFLPCPQLDLYKRESI